MKFSLSWLKDHLETDADAAVIADTLTRIGLEVEGVDNPAEALRPFTVARVLTAERHPQADKLQVLTVDSGDGNAMQVVCGAPNARAGLIGVFGGPGTYVPGSDFVLKKAAIRGVESNGMMCSARELQLGEDHDGIIELPEDAPVGTSFADYAGLDDAVFDVAITPNRQDCMGVRGIARDLAAAGVGTLKPLEVPAIEGSFDNPVEIRVEDPEGCPAFYGRTVRGLTNGASPEWMQRRLKAAGQRPISALVDVTNYVMLDLGRPAHAYDLKEIRGAVAARRARDGEKVLALNEKEYLLDGTMTVIADEAQVHDIGGIMGGEHSGVSEATTETLLEIAYFTPANIASTGQRLQLASDARSRFERGVDEAVTWSFISEPEAALFGGAAHVLANPISEEMKHMRPSMLPGLAAAARRNADRGASNIRLFEIGRRYLAEAERPTVGILLAGEKSPRSWQGGKAQGFDAFDAKAEVLALLEAAGAPVAGLQLGMGAGETWHPGRSATLGLGKNILAAFGELHPSVAKALDAPAGTVAAEVYLDAIPAPRTSEHARPAYSPPALQTVKRDFAFLVPGDLAADTLVRAIRSADKALITDARLFDRYEGEQGLSLAIEVTLQPGEKSFTDAEIGEVSRKIVAAAEKLGAQLRG